MRTSPLWPNRRVKPPYGSVEIDWAHPLADRLTGFWLLNGGLCVYDLVRPSSAPMTIGAAGVVGSNEGLRFDGTGYIYQANKYSYIESYPHTIAGSVRATKNGGVIFGLFNVANPVKAQLYTLSNGLAYYMRAETGGDILPSKTITLDGKPHLYAGISTASNAHYAAIDGSFGAVNTTAQGTYVGYPMSVYFGANPSAGDKSASGDYIEWAATWNNRALASYEMVYLRWNPYCFLRPRHERSYGFLTTATTTFWLPSITRHHTIPSLGA